MSLHPHPLQNTFPIPGNFNDSGQENVVYPLRGSPQCRKQKFSSAVYTVTVASQVASLVFSLISRFCLFIAKSNFLDLMSMLCGRAWHDPCHKRVTALRTNSMMQDRSTDTAPWLSVSRVLLLNFRESLLPRPSPYQQQNWRATHFLTMGDRQRDGGKRWPPCRCWVSNNIQTFSPVVFPFGVLCCG